MHVCATLATIQLDFSDVLGLPVLAWTIRMLGNVTSTSNSMLPFAHTTSSQCIVYL